MATDDTDLEFDLFPSKPAPAGGGDADRRIADEDNLRDGHRGGLSRGQLTLLPLDAETRAQLEQLAALPVEMRTEDGSLAWLCPHCDVVVIAEPGEDEASIKSDPACSGCRARYHGLTHKQVAALAASGAPPASPPAGWRRAHA